MYAGDRDENCRRERGIWGLVHARSDVCQVESGPMQTFVVKADGSHLAMDRGLGARGEDISTVTSTSLSGSSTVTTSLPTYDAHGNEIASLTRDLGNSYGICNQRSYGAWGARYAPYRPGFYG